MYQQKSGNPGLKKKFHILAGLAKTEALLL
jgi:hypothetical protein